MSQRVATTIVQLLVTSSCYKIEEVGTTTTLSYPHGVVLAVGAASLIALAIGLWLMRRTQLRKLGLWIAVCAGAGAAGVAPGMWVDRVTITPTEIRHAA